MRQSSAEPEQLLAANRALTALSECNEAVLKAEDESQLLQAVCDIAVKAAGYTLAWVGVPDADCHVSPVASCGNRDYLERITVTCDDSPLGRGPVGIALRTALTQFVNDSPSDDSLLPWREEALACGFHSAAALPIINEGIPEAVFVLYSERLHAFDSEELKLLERLAANVAFGLRTLRQDIRSRQVAEQLRESEELFRIAFDAPPMGVAFMKPTGHLFKVNERLHAMLGFASGELPGRHFMELTPVEDAAASIDLLDRLVHGKADSGWLEKRCLRKDDEVIWTHVFAAIKRDKAGRGEFLILLVQDVTERKFAADELVETKSFLEALYQASPDMIFVHGPDGQLIDVNDNVLHRYGFTRHEMLTLPFSHFIAEEIEPEQAMKLVRRAKGGEVLDFEFQARNKAGAVFPVEVRLRRVSEKAGPGRVLAVVRDISERKRAEVALRERTRDLDQRVKELHCLYDISRLLESQQGAIETLFQQVVDRLPGGFQHPEETVVRLTFAGRCYTSAETTGAETGATIGVSLRIPEEPEGRLEAFFRGKVAGGAFLEEETSLITVVKEQIERVLERRHSDERLRKNRAQLAKAQRLAHLGSWEWHMGSGALIWSEETYRMFGVDASEAVSYERFLGRVHPDDRELVDSTVRKALEKLAPYQIDHRIIRSDGLLRYVHEEGEIIFDDEGNPSRMIGIAQDITHRKQSEEALRNSYLELKSAHQRLKEMNAQLIQSEKMASIGQLAAGVAHEINNPGLHQCECGQSAILSERSLGDHSGL